MLIAHNPQIISVLCEPTASSPWRVLISGCLSGLPCGVNGTDYSTPRTMPDLHDGDGFAVLDGMARILDEHRRDLTEGVLTGARAMLEQARAVSIDCAVLTDRSAACGSQVISIGCRFEAPVHHAVGVGVATAMLLRAGFHVVSQRDPRTLALLGKRLDPDFAPAPG